MCAFPWLRKVGGPAIQSTLGVERADSFCTGVGAPTAPAPVVLAAENSQDDNGSEAKTPEERRRSSKAATMDFTSLSQFGPRVELYRGRWVLRHQSSRFGRWCATPVTYITALLAHLLLRLKLLI